MWLHTYSITELQEELDRRKKERKEKPKPVENPDWSYTKSICIRILDEMHENGYVDEDDPHYIYETAMIAVFGNGIFEYINSLDDWDNGD